MSISWRCSLRIDTYLETEKSTKKSQIPNPKSQIVTLCQIGGCAADNQTKRGETPIDQNPATASQ